MPRNPEERSIQRIGKTRILLLLLVANAPFNKPTIVLRQPHLFLPVVKQTERVAVPEILELVADTGQTRGA